MPLPATASRRDKMRAATEEEIRATARTLLVTDGAEAMTLRAIARAMGMTAPALYRYVDSHQDLVALVTVDCYDELVSVMTRAREQRGQDDLAGQLIAVSRAFRRWALEHPREFGLVFTNPMTQLLTQSEDAVEAAAQRFGLVFGELFAGVLRQYGTQLPEHGQITPAYVAELEAVDPEKVAGMPLGARYLFLSAWVRLYGCVCMEVFGHLAWAVQDTEPVFEEALRDCATLIGIADEYERSR